MRALAASAALVLLVLLTTAGQFAGRPVSVPLPGESSPPDTASSTTWMTRNETRTENIFRNETL